MPGLSDDNTNGLSAISRSRFPRLRVFTACICLIGTPGAAAWVGGFFSYSADTPRTEIYRGIYYESHQTTYGVVHLVEVDLSRPGIELFLTPVDGEALANGHQYRLDYVRNAARAEGLAVAVNGTQFGSDSYLMRMVGDFATSMDTIVSDYQINHLQARDYMLWFDDRLTPYLETSRPAPLEALERARWAIGVQNLAARGSQRAPKGGQRDKRCAIGVDPEKRRMWIGVFGAATFAEATAVLLDAGAEYVMMLDGGDSTSLYLGGRTYGVPGGLRFGGQRPVATVFGIKADPILEPL